MKNIDNLKVKITSNPDSNLFINDMQTILPLSEGIVGVFGESGAGKSTLLRCLAGLEKNTGVQLHWQSNVFENVTPDKNPCLLQTQQARLFPNLTVLKNLEVVIKHSNWTSNTPFDLHQVVKWCGINHLLSQAASNLSGGEQQRVNLARSLLCGKPIILLDEPFSALDWQARTQLLTLLVHLQQTYKIHFVIVSHSLKELSLCTENLMVINQGNLVQTARTETLIYKLSTSSKQSVFSTLELNNPIHLAQYQLTKWQFFSKETVTDADNSTVFIYTKGLHKQFSSEEIQYPSPHLVNLDANRVSLSKEPNLNTSMLNHIKAQIMSINHVDHNVLVTLDAYGQTLYVEISPLSFFNLNLQVNETVFAQFKAL